MALSPLFIDLSNNDPILDAVKYRKSGHVAIGLKATEGTSFVDPDHSKLAHEAGSQGIAVFHYHFARPDAGTRPEDEAHHFLTVATSGDLDGPRDYLILDLERATPSGWSHDPAWAYRFDKYVRANSRFRTILYSYRAAMVGTRAASWFVAEPYRVWEADYSATPDAGPIGCQVVMRQFTDGVFGPQPHTLPGGPSHCDVSIMRGGFRANVFAAA